MASLTLGDLDGEPYGTLRIREVVASELPAADMNGASFFLD